MLMSVAEDGVVSRVAFDQFIGRMVKASSLSTKEKMSFATLLSSVYTCFDRDGRRVMCCVVGAVVLLMHIRVYCSSVEEIAVLFGSQLIQLGGTVFCRGLSLFFLAYFAPHAPPRGPGRSQRTLFAVMRACLLCCVLFAASQSMRSSWHRGFRFCATGQR